MKNFKQKLKYFGHRCYIYYRWNRFQYYLARKKSIEEWKNRGCEYCGKKPICQECGRCYNSNCNAGCIFCIDSRSKPKEYCNCCGQGVG